jgi:hypothetical protein
MLRDNQRPLAHESVGCQEAVEALTAPVFWNVAAHSPTINASADAYPMGSDLGPILGPCDDECTLGRTFHPSRLGNNARVSMGVSSTATH